MGILLGINLAYYVPFFAECRRVLDVGCGEGQFIELLQDKGTEAAGIDLDAGMVAVCREKGLDLLLGLSLPPFSLEGFWQAGE